MSNPIGHDAFMNNIHKSTKKTTKSKMMKNVEEYKRSSLITSTRSARTPCLSVIESSSVNFFMYLFTLLDENHTSPRDVILNEEFYFIPKSYVAILSICGKSAPTCLI